MDERTQGRILVCLAGSLVLFSLASREVEGPAPKPAKFELVVIGYVDKVTGTLSFSEPTDFEDAFRSYMPSFSRKKVSTDLEATGLFLPGTREYEAAIQKKVEPLSAWKQIDPRGRPDLPPEILQGDSYAIAEPK